MTSIRVEIVRGATEAREGLQRVEDSVSGAGLRLLLGDVGEYLLGSTRERARREVSPEGVPWQKLSRRYAKQKAKKRPGASILRFDDELLGARLNYQVQGPVLQLGTNAPYGAIRIKARSATLRFQRGRGGKLRFGKGKRVVRTIEATIPAHDVRIPQRKWLGLSTADQSEIGVLVGNRYQLAFGSGRRL